MNAALPETGLHYLDEYTRHKEELPGANLPWLLNLREAAIRHFTTFGFPTLRDEDWKYTSVAPIEKARFALAAKRTVDQEEGGYGDSSIDAAQVDSLTLPDAQRLVFIDGRCSAALSRLDALPKNVTVAGLADMLADRPLEIEAAFNRLPRRAAGFIALNTACMTDGAYIHVPPHVTLPMPLHLLFVTTTPELAIHTRNLVYAEHDCRIDIVEHHIAVGAAARPKAAGSFSNVVSELTLGRAARVGHYKLQQESKQAFHIASIRAVLAREASFNSASFALGGALARVDLRVQLNGAGAQCTLDGLYMVDGRRHVDHHTCIDHNLPRGTSRQLYKGVLGGAARGVFNGKIVVHPDAQQSDAEQTNRNLLLSAQAEVDTKPQLEIWADDVKCSHGATVGQLDAEQIFYLRTRGVGEASARALLTHAFAAEMIDRVALPTLRERLDYELRKRLPPGLAPGLTPGLAQLKAAS